MPRARKSTHSEPGAVAARVSMALAASWVVGALAVAAALLGPAQLTSLTPTQTGALAAVALFPALMAWFAGAAARDGARARAEAQRLADAADRLLNPSQSAEASTHRLAMAVRAEIGALDRALEATLARVKEVETAVARQARTVIDMAGQAKAGAGHMISGMEHERDELLKISRDLTTHAETIGNSISRHTQSITAAARQAESEVRAADQALDQRLTSFGAAAALITDRTQGLSGAAQASADSALRLEGALSNALEVLAKATELTDAARQSADTAMMAATQTAGAVRDTTFRAIDDAKRAADLIRGEASRVERDAGTALERLREAADAARFAAIGARTAVENSDFEPRRTRADEHSQPVPTADWRKAHDPLEAAPPPPRRASERNGDRNSESLPNPASPPRRPLAEPDRPAPASGWTWRELLTGFDSDAPPAPKPAAARGAAHDIAAEPRRHSAPSPSAQPAPGAVDVITKSGMRLHDVFSPSALERIAQRARAGSQARRRAVKDAAPDAVERMGQHLARDAKANQEAMAFLRNDGARIAEMLGRGRAAMDAEATRAFLLIDAAAG